MRARTKFAILISTALIFASFIAYNINLTRTPYRTDEQNHRTPSNIQVAKKAEPKDTVFILAIDGGGLRGIIPLHALSYIEKVTGKPISDMFDLITGTSSGGITTVMLTLPNADGKPKFTAAETLKFYHEFASQIFGTPWYHKLFTLDGLIAPRFISENAHAAYTDALGNITLTQLRTHVLLPSIELSSANPQVFTNWPQENSSLEDFFVCDVLAGSTAAPPYFRPATLSSIDNKRTYTILDSGLYTNDPALSGLLTAMHLYPNRKYVLVSLGTGYEVPQVKLQKVYKWGLLQWLPELYPLAINTQTNGLDRHLEMLAEQKSMKLNYYRININIPNASHLEFDASPENLGALDDYGEIAVKNNQLELKAVIDALTSKNPQ